MRSARGRCGSTRISPRKSPILPIKFSSHRSVERLFRDILTETRGMLERESRSVRWRLLTRPTPQIGPFEDPTRFRSRHALSDACASHGPGTPTRRRKILEKMTHPLPPRPRLRSETRAATHPRGCAEPRRRASPRSASARRRSMEDRRIGTRSISSAITTTTSGERSPRPSGSAGRTNTIDRTPNGTYAPTFFCC